MSPPKPDLPPDDLPPDELPLVLAFARVRPARPWAVPAALLARPREALAVLRARLLGRRLRARQSLAALVGIDHRLALPLSRLPETEPAAALSAHGIATDEAAASPCAPILLLGAPGHRLAAGAAAAIARAFAGEAGLHALYGDALARMGVRVVPLLRPAFDPDYLRALDYVGPLVALRRSSLTGIEARDALSVLLALDRRHGAGAVAHLPRVLSVWDVAAAPRADGSLRLARVRADLAARGEGAQATLTPQGLVRVVHSLPEPAPLVSLIVPTRDRLDLLRPCLESLIARTDWPAREILVVDNGSREPETHAYLRALDARGLARTVPWPGPFDFAGMNNAAAGEARGRLLAFVNNDAEAFQPGWLRAMAREALRPDVGAVGAKLLDGRGRIQHGGVVPGTGGLVTHGHRHFPGDAPGYLGALLATHRVGAVTAACLVVEADKFRAVGGFDAARFAVDFNDVDLCLRLEAAGFRTLLVPEAVLHHREAASRPRSAAARVRHEEEVARLRARWGPRLAADPWYHPGFDPDLSTHARLRGDWTGATPAAPR